MVSPELLRYYPFFGWMDGGALRDLAMIADEIRADAEDTIIEPEQPANYFYVLVEGAGEVIYKVVDRDDPHLIKEFYVGDVIQGDVFGLSALMEPHLYTTKVKITAPSRIIRIEALALRELCEDNMPLAYGLIRQLARVALERLHHVRTLLAAERAV